MADPDPADALREADRRLVRRVDGLVDDGWEAPSLLPGWTRAHVVAHLALNAEALTGVVDGVMSGEPVPMYPSDEVRDADIAELASGPADVLRDRLLGATTLAAEAFERLVTAGRERPEALAARVERTPGGPTFAVGASISMRLREVEIHHADLGAGYTYADWSVPFARLVLDTLAAGGRPVADCVVAPDGDPHRWVFGDAGPVVSGPVQALAWWVTGRPAGPELVSDSGSLPRTEAW